MRPPPDHIALVGAMGLRLAPLTQRLHPGPEYASTLNGFALALNIARLSRRGQRAFERAVAYAARHGDVRLTARLYHAQAPTRDFAQPMNATTGAETLRMLEPTADG